MEVVQKKPPLSSLKATRAKQIRRRNVDIKHFPAWLPVNLIPRNGFDIPPVEGSIADTALKLYRQHQEVHGPGLIPSLSDAFKIADAPVEKPRDPRLNNLTKKQRLHLRRSLRLGKLFKRLRDCHEEHQKPGGGSLAARAARKRSELLAEQGIEVLRDKKLYIPLLGVRDRASHWFRIKHNFTRLRDPTQAIFPYKWHTHPLNPKVLINPGLCSEDPLRGACLPKEDAWVIKTRYGGDEAVKWRKFELVDKRDCHRHKAYNNWRRGYLYETGRADPIARNCPSFTIGSYEKINLFNRQPTQDPKPSIVYADKHQTGFALGDSIVAERRNAARLESRKRKAEDSEPDLTDRQPQNPPPRISRQNANTNRDSRLKFVRPMFRAVTGGCFAIMKGIVSAVWSAGLSRLFGSGTRRVGERGTVNTRTGNVTSKRLKLDLQQPRWITEAERKTLYMKRHRLIAALNHTHNCIYHATLPQAERKATFTGDRLKHTDLSLYASLLDRLETAFETLDIFYSANLLSHLSRLYKVPEPNMLYLPNPDEQIRIESTSALLEELPPDLWQILYSFDVSHEDTEAVRKDLEAVIAHQPIPSLCVGFFSHTIHHASLPVSTPSSLIGGDDNDVDVYGSSDSAQSSSSGSTGFMPGTFPEEPGGDEPKTVRYQRRPREEKPFSHRTTSGGDDAPLPLFHKTIPIEIVRQHLIPPEFVTNFGQQGRLTKARHRDAAHPRGIMLSPLQGLSPTKDVSPRRQRKIAYRNRKSVKWDPNLSAREYKPDDPYHWRYNPNQSTFNTEGRPYIDFDTAENEDKDFDSEILTIKTPSTWSSPFSAPPASPPPKPADRVRTSPQRRLARKASLSSSPQSSPLSKKTFSIRGAVGTSRSDQELADTNGVRLSPQTDKVTGGDLGARVNSQAEIQSSAAIVSDPMLSERELSALRKARVSILSKLKPTGLPFHHEEDVTPRTGDSKPVAAEESTVIKAQEAVASLGSQVRELAISDEKEGDLGDHGAQQQLQADEIDHMERQEREKREIEKTRQAQEERLRLTGGLRLPSASMISTLPDNWKQRIQATLTGPDENQEFVQTKSGNPLRKRDFAKLVPPTAWLNDEVINGALEWLDDFINAGTSSQGRRCLSINSFVWNRIKDGMSTDRVMKRADVSGAESFLKLDTVLIPICAGNHWTLLVIRPRQRTIAHMDSLNAAGSPYVIRIASNWVMKICGDRYAKEEWRVVKHAAPEQCNGWDCGVHVITNGMCVALGLNPADTYKSDQLPLQRRRIAGVLLNRGFRAEFELSKL